MARVIGRLTKIGLGRETVRGTSVAPLYWIPVLDLGFDDKIELKDNESGFGNLANINDSQVVKQWAEGDYAGKIFDKSVGLELVGVFGQLPTSTQRTTTGVYDNVYGVLQSNQHASLTAAVAEANFSGRYALGMINSWALEAEVGDYVKRTVNLISQQGATSSETPAYTNENEFIAKHISVRFAAAGSNDTTLDAATAAKIRSINFEINKNADGLQVFGSNSLDDIVNKAMEVTGEFEMYYDDRTFHNLAKAGTHQAMRIEMINSDVIIGTSGSHNPALRFTFREVALEWPERSFDNNDIATVKVSFRAMLNLATGTQVEARLTNAVNGAATY
jgi:hypothetical protein